jgi:hypothetical protein
MKEQIIETWHINNRVHLMLIDAISDEGLHCTLSKRGGGTPAKQFTHLHNLRLWRLEKVDKELLKGQSKIDTAGTIDKALLKKRLNESGAAIAKMIENGIVDGGKIKGFKRGVIPFLGYMISHESHHRGNILLTLKQCGHKIPKDVQYGIWAWNQI